MGKTENMFVCLHHLRNRDKREKENKVGSVNSVTSILIRDTGSVVFESVRVDTGRDVTAVASAFI